MGLYGQILNVTINPIEALANSSSGSLVGFGLTMEGQEGNEIMYDLLLDQAVRITGSLVLPCLILLCFVLCVLSPPINFLNWKHSLPLLLKPC